MKKIIGKLAIYLLSILFSTTLLFVFIVQVIPVQFDQTYQYEINEKYERLNNVDAPKIIITGGSATAFGLNQDIVESEIFKPVINMALHAGFGMQFETEVTKGNINSGDIVILVYEYSQWSKLYWDSSLFITAVDNHIDMYKYIPIEFIEETINYIPTYAAKKIDSYLGINKISAFGNYSIGSFKNGNMILDRPVCALPYPVPEETFGKAVINPEIINTDVVDYVNQFNKYVTSKGATLLISFPPVLNEMVFSSKEEIYKFELYLNKLLDSPIISKVEDYIFNRKYIFDSIYHCNNLGEEKRSYLLLRDLLNFINQN